jgi:hypothetical protein
MTSEDYFVCFVFQFYSNRHPRRPNPRRPHHYSH